ncbi:MAG: phosphopentomutase [Gemmatimonadetes bacterium]|nr:MAG: phosphopentomutase [Gemmatimonadota bacterium]
MSIIQRVCCIILDGVGCGELPDAAHYHDEGSDTLANCAQAVGGFQLPNLQQMGLGNIHPILGVAPVESPAAAYGKMQEQAAGKDSTTGHWEICGLILNQPFPTYPKGFPPEVIAAFREKTGLDLIGNTTASGTAIILELGDEHVRTGKPIVYTSADSVFQIAAHEEVIPLERLYEMCRIVREEICVGEHAVGRVIARPFVGTSGTYQRVAEHRHDFSLPPTGQTLFDRLHEAGIPTIAIGKIGDLFAQRGIDHHYPTKSNQDGIQQTLHQLKTMSHGFIMTNLVDFDTEFGHRNDPVGFYGALQEFDRSLPAILDQIDDQTLLIITADHGNDPTTPSTDHSREYVPLLVYGRQAVNLGVRSTFADVGQTIADYFQCVPAGLSGQSFRALLEPPLA